MSEIDLEPVREWISRWEWARARRAELDEVEKQARTQIEECMGQHETGTLDGTPIFSWKETVAKTGRVDTKMLREQYPDIAAICTVKSTSRPFRRVEG